MERVGMIPFGSQLVDVVVLEDRVEVYRRAVSMTALGNGLRLPDRMFKQVYKPVAGKMVLVDTLEGKVTPAYTVPEQVEWPEPVDWLGELSDEA